MLDAKLPQDLAGLQALATPHGEQPDTWAVFTLNPLLVSRPLKPIDVAQWLTFISGPMLERALNLMGGRVTQTGRHGGTASGATQPLVTVLEDLAERGDASRAYIVARVVKVTVRGGKGKHAGRREVHVADAFGATPAEAQAAAARLRIGSVGVG